MLTVLQGDCLKVMPTLAADSFDSIVTDPPYHLTSIVKRLSKTSSTDVEKNFTKTIDGQGTNPFQSAARGFMGQAWDGGDIAHDPVVWRECLRLAKPGAHLLAFGGTRTFHRLACAIEDAGWELRDTIMWVYGSGFPKSRNLDGEWDGWGTALKPAWEPIIVARKAVDGTVAENMKRHGTGAINVDASRVGVDPDIDDPRLGGKGDWSTDKCAKNVYEGGYAGKRTGSSPLGRWPANLIHDGSEEVLATFPNAPGQLADVKYDADARKTGHVYGAMNRGNEPSADSENVGVVGFKMKRGTGVRRQDDGSAARFFYCAKASKEDRDEGLFDVPKSLFGMSGAAAAAAARGEEYDNGDGGVNRTSMRRNTHPTVKPTALMQYLVRLVTRPGGHVLDPFAGSGSTGKAALIVGCKATLIELNPDYCELIRKRCRVTPGLGI